MGNVTLMKKRYQISQNQIYFYSLTAIEIETEKKILYSETLKLNQNCANSQSKK